MHEAVMHQAMSTRATGTVQWFDDAREEGLIRCDGGERDCFVHKSAIHPDDRELLMEGTRVTFDVLEAPGGASAVNVARL
jgi:cold shock protein